MSNLELFLGRVLPILGERERQIFLGALIEFEGPEALKNIHEITGLSQAGLIAARREAESIEPNPKVRGFSSNVKKAKAGRKGS